MNSPGEIFADGSAGDATPHQVAGAGTGRSAWRFAAPLAIVLILLAAFMPALDADYVNWDDDDLLFATTRYRVLDFDSLSWMFTTSYTGHFQPLTWLSYHVDWSVWGREAFGYHLTNVLLHAGTALIFYFLTRRLLAIARGRDEDRYAGPMIWASTFAALLFAVHPLRAESVAWIAERRDVLGGLFYVACVTCYVRYAMTTGPRRAWYAGTIGLCVLSLLAKASAMTVPVVLLILDVYPLRRWRAGAVASHTGDTRDGAGATFGRLLAEKLPLFVLAITAAVRALIAQAEGGALYGLTEHGVVQRLAQAAYGLVFYAWKTVLPTGLGPLYQIPDDATLFGPMLWISGVALVAAFAMIVRLRRAYPGLVAAAAAYVVILAPILGAAQSGPQIVADRYSYLACMGLAVLAGGAALALLEWASARPSPSRRALTGLILMALPIVSAKATFQQNEYWQTGFTLWMRGVSVSPTSSVAYTNLADALANNGSEQFPDAIGFYRRALELNPDDFVALHHLAELQRRTGDADSAIRHYIQSLAINPGQLDACFALGRTLVDVGRPAQAVIVLRDGAQRHPQARELIDYLARLLGTHANESVRNPGEAVDWALQLNRLDDFQNPVSLMTLATAYAAADRFDDAVKTTELAIGLTDDRSNQALVAELHRRLQLFRQHRPYRYGN